MADSRRKPKAAAHSAGQENRKAKPGIKSIVLVFRLWGKDLGLEGGFEVLKQSVNTKVHPDWETTPVSSRWVRLGKTCFKTVFANDVKPEAKAVWP